MGREIDGDIEMEKDKEGVDSDRVGRKREREGEIEGCGR